MFMRETLCVCALCGIDNGDTRQHQHYCVNRFGLQSVFRKIFLCLHRHRYHSPLLSLQTICHNNMNRQLFYSLKKIIRFHKLLRWNKKKSSKWLVCVCVCVMTCRSNNEKLVNWIGHNDVQCALNCVYKVRMFPLNLHIDTNRAIKAMNAVMFTQHRTTFAFPFYCAVRTIQTHFQLNGFILCVLKNVWDYGLILILIRHLHTT